MSIARVKTQRARKSPGQCEHCRDLIHVGQEYRSYKVGFRSRLKHVRCMKPECTPKASELESSLLATVYAAQESAESYIEGADGSPEDKIQVLRDGITGVVEALGEVADQYEEADNAMGAHQGESYEKAETLRNSADQLESVSLEDWDERPCVDHDEWKDDCDACQQLQDDWWDDQKAEALSNINEVELP